MASLTLYTCQGIHASTSSLWLLEGPSTGGGLCARGSTAPCFWGGKVEGVALRFRAEVALVRSGCRGREKPGRFPSCCEDLFMGTVLLVPHGLQHRHEDAR